MQTAVPDRLPPATWPEFWREVARRAALRSRSLWSAADQPAWARPLLLLTAAVSAWSYAWRATRPVNIEIYYAAAVRSMTSSMSNFFFGALDPAGTVTTDKLPGALWLQAISVGVFGPHNWALVLPQVIEGALTVLVLYRAVRQVAGPAAGLIAAGLLAISPATVALNRGNVSDTLMIVLAVLAADAMISAVSTGRWRPLLLAGLWIGLAFQAKMLEAWLVLPALAGCYLLAAPGGWLRRAWRGGAMVLLAVVVSLSWMSLVTVWPAGSRPYIDGSTGNSAFQQVFIYNGFGRLDQATPDQLVNRTIRLGLAISPQPSWHRLLSGELGRDTAWLLAAAMIALLAGLLARRRQPRTDLVRAGLVLWGTWLVTLFAVFSAATTINSYYAAALSPAVAALLAIGLTLAWRHRERPWSWLALGAAVLATAGYSAWLLPASGTGLPGWLRPVAIALAAAAACVIAAAASRPSAKASRRPAAALAAVAVTLATAATLIVPATASAAVVSTGLGPFETPFEPARETADITAFLSAGFQIKGSLVTLERANAPFVYLMATQTAVLAAPFIWASGREVVPIGGFTGTIPEPTLATLQHLIRTGFVATFLQSPTTNDPRLTWVAHHCMHITPKASAPHAVLPLAVYVCLANT
ncbi:MAG: glycosyltransferase family 39 protein [Streptosporangiaceae bacterium]